METDVSTIIERIILNSKNVMDEDLKKCTEIQTIEQMLKDAKVRIKFSMKINPNNLDQHSSRQTGTELTMSYEPFVKHQNPLTRGGAVSKYRFLIISNDLRLPLTNLGKSVMATYHKEFKRFIALYDEFIKTQGQNTSK